MTSENVIQIRISAKRIGLVLVFLFSFLMLQAQDEEPENSKLPPKRMLKTNPFVVMQGPIPLSAEYRLGYEHVLRSRHSYVLSVSYLNHSALDLLTQVRAPETRYRGFRTQLMYRIYLTPRYYSPRGFFMGPHASFSYLEVNETYSGHKQKEFISFTNLNLISGYQVIIGSSISLELFAGIGAKRNYYNLDSFYKGHYSVEQYGPKFSFGTNAGLVF